MTQGELLCLLLPVLVPLTWVRSFSVLAAISSIGNFVFMVAGATVLLDGFQRFGPPQMSDFGPGGEPHARRDATHTFPRGRG